jgi:Glycosyl transferase family 11
MDNGIVAVNMQGGLGNMMFQAAFALAFSFENNCRYALQNFEESCRFNSLFLRRESFSYEHNVFRHFDLNYKIHRADYVYEVPFHFTLPHYNKNKINFYKGYFQSQKYFLNYHDQIKSYYWPENALIKFIKNKYSFDFQDFISIHVRRGDYLSQQSKHPVVTLDYLEKSIKYFGPNKKYLVASDDIFWCKNILKHIPNVVFIENESDVISLYMMSLCSHNIISNSSFSWWSAWLNKNSDKKIIRPEIWFGKDYESLNIKDICPESWMAL